MTELKEGVPLPDVGAAWHGLVRDLDPRSGFRAYEACTMMSLRKSLRRGSVWLDHSLSFRERDQMLIPPADWAVQRDERERHAAAYLGGWGAESTHHVISGDYQSEGRNAIENQSVLIPKDSEEAGFREMVEGFAVRVDAAVAQTYAVRLLAMGVRDTGVRGGTLDLSRIPEEARQPGPPTIHYGARYVPTDPPPRHVPVAEFVIGCFHHGAGKPYKTTVVKSDSLLRAMQEGRATLRPGVVESVRLVETRPNPDYDAYMKERGLRDADNESPPEEGASRPERAPRG